MTQDLLKKWKDEYLESDSTYTNHVTKFVDYLSVIGKSNQPNNIAKEDIENSVKYYNEFGSIRTRTSMENHLEAIKAFYKYLVSKHYTDDIFNNTSSYQEFKDIIAEKCNLLEAQERGPWKEDELIEIVKHLDAYFEQSQIQEKWRTNKKHRYFKMLLLRIFIKLTLIAPAKKSVICSLKRSDFSDDYRSVHINSVAIRIPNALRRDLIFSINLINECFNCVFNDEDLLFDHLHRGRFNVENLNGIFYTFLKHSEIIDVDPKADTYQVEVIMNSALFSLFRNGTNLALISKISGVKLSSLERKLNSIGIQVENADELINNEISRTKYYNYI